MMLQQLLELNPQVRLAKKEDDQYILDFFHSLSMQGKGLQLYYDRSPDFFAFLEYQSSDYFVFMLMAQDKIQGVGTLLIRPGFIDKQLQNVGYLGDLRVRGGKRNAINWRKFYQDLMRWAPEIEEFKGAKYFQTAIIDSNTQARSSLVTSKKAGFAYHLLHPYHMVNVCAKRPWAKCKSQVKVRPARPEDKDGIYQYWIHAESQKQFGQPELLHQALNKWDDFDWEKILLAEDKGQIVGMCGHWSPRKVKKIILLGLPLRLRVLIRTIKFFKSFPSEGEELRPLYMTLLNFERAEVLEAMLFYTQDKLTSQGGHLISFCGFPGTHYEEAIKGFFCDRMAMGLYQVYHNERPDLRLRGPHAPPGFEMSLV